MKHDENEQKMRIQLREIERESLKEVVRLSNNRLEDRKSEEKLERRDQFF